MRAISSAALPPAWRSYGGMLWHHRVGLTDPATMPRIERSATAATLEPRWLEAYRACVGLPHDAAVSLPPLALQIAAAPLHLAILADPQFPFKAIGLIHVAQSVVQTEPIASGQALVLRAYTSSAHRVRRGMQFSLATEALVDGRHVCRSETTALAKDTTSRPQSLRNSPSGHSSQDTSISARWNEVTTAKVPESMGRRYAAIAGDLNPIHQHALLARPFGFPHVIIHGTWTLARGLAAAALPTSASYALTAQFRNPVFLPSNIVILTRRNGQCDELKVTDPGGALVHVSAQVSAADVEVPKE